MTRKRGRKGPTLHPDEHREEAAELLWSFYCDDVFEVVIGDMEMSQPYGTDRVDRVSKALRVENLATNGPTRTSSCFHIPYWRCRSTGEYFDASKVPFEDMPDDVFGVIVDGYNDVIAYGAERGVKVITENHWGPGRYPKNCVKLVETIDGLGFLFDSNNWAEGYQLEGWELCAKLAEVTHIKTFQFDESGWDPTVVAASVAAHGSNRDPSAVRAGSKPGRAGPRVG